MEINLKILNLGNATYLNTKELTEEERNDRTFDFLGGFEIIDTDMRLFVIEGLGGPNNSIDQFYRANERQEPNSKNFKMLYNPKIKFKNRAYINFNVALKLIKLRTSLTQTVGAPEIYLRSKVPEDMYDTIVKFAEMRKLDRANLVANFDLFPSYDNLVTFERKYGDSITYQDQHGVQKKKKKKRARKGAVGTTDDGITGSLRDGSIG